MSEIKKNVNVLIQKTDQLFGSVVYMSDEYDDFNLKVSKTVKISKEVSEIKQSVKQIKIRKETTESQVDQLEQYGRRENLEIYGVPVSSGDNIY